MSRSIAVVTVARSDYGIYQSILRAISADAEFELRIIATGMHLAPEFGFTANMIEQDGYAISDRVEMLLASDSPESIAKSIGLGVIGFSQVFGRQRPDVLVVLGDRFDMYPAALAALPFRIPVAHIHGGEVSFGAIDDALRHSLTKLSHLHFVATEDSARRVIQMGEEPWRVQLTGAPALDNLEEEQSIPPLEIERRFGISLSPSPLLVTFHPATLEYEDTEQQIGTLLDALADSGHPVIFTAPNADTAGRLVRQAVDAFVSSHPAAWLVENFGRRYYFGILPYVTAMVGNSSSGLVEAPSFGVPVVNVGNRQAGRTRGRNVIDTDFDRKEIVLAIARATSPEFRAVCQARVNPYRPTNGSAAERIVETLKTIPLDQKLVTKRFHDIGV